ncbi:MAG: putative cupredoxin-like copper-binding protein [Gammaproteobacteria bacterium]|jgi:uncharacterized cupredoxin-like copper-binding protein
MKTLQSLLVISAILVLPAIQASGDLSRANVQTVVLEMGTRDGRMYFEPNHLTFETGQAYKIVLRNVDTVKHEVEASEFAEKVFTRKVEIRNGKYLVAEVKGSIREIEVGPKSEVEWFVVPVQTGKKMEMVCALPGHKEAGMFGTVTVN